MLYYERKFKKQGYDFVIGIDEAGRGPLAGPVVAAAVILLSSRFKTRIDDSKKLTAQQRNKAFLELTKKSVFGIGIINEKIVDCLNILQATRVAMRIAVEQLIDRFKPGLDKRVFLLIDGNMRIDVDFPNLAIVKGDAKSKSIAAASIIAKVTRDRIMDIYDKIYPQYGFIRHKGYPTDIHRKNLNEFGPCLIHRRSFIGV